MVSVSSCSQCYVEWLLSIHCHGQSVFTFSVLCGMVAKHTLPWSKCLHVLSVMWNGCKAYIGMVNVSSCSQCYVEWLLSIHWHG